MSAALARSEHGADPAARSSAGSTAAALPPSEDPLGDSGASAGESESDDREVPPRFRAIAKRSKMIACSEIKRD